MLRGPITRRYFVSCLGGAGVAWPLAARAQQTAMPVIAFISGRSADASTRYVAAFRKGLNETGYVEGRNVLVEYNWLEGHYDRLPALLTDLIGRRVAVLTTPGSTPGAIAAKAATSTIPIVFSVAQDPVKLGLVSSLAHPGGNATGINFFAQEAAGKRLALLHDLVPKAVNVAVFINPANASSAEYNFRQVQQAAPSFGLKIQQVVKASTVAEIDAVFAALEREQPDALFVAGDGFFDTRARQIAALAAHAKIPAAYQQRENVEAGGLMSYGTDFVDMYRQVGVYAGSILKGAEPMDMPVQQATKFEFVINLQTARGLGIEVPPTLLALADGVIE
jgi:putative ABC transport system substrate-binding protein